MIIMFSVITGENLYIYISYNLSSNKYDVVGGPAINGSTTSIFI